MPIYFVRHGKSAANVRGVFAGQKDDSPLVEEGFAQAKDAAQYLVKLPIKKVFSSPLLRARQTSEVIMDILGKGVPFEVDPRINEYDMGSLTSQPIRAVTSRELVSSVGAESSRDFRDRILSFLKELYDEKEIVVMVSHAGVGRMIGALQKGIDPEEFYSIKPYPNARATELDFSWWSNPNS